MQIRQKLIPIGWRRNGKKLIRNTGVTIHNTGNDGNGANADAHARLQFNDPNPPSQPRGSWHWTVDEKEAVQSIPNDEIAKHAGTSYGNETTVGIEICENKNGNLLEATNNAAVIAAQVLKGMGYRTAIWKQNIFQHNDWSGKDCPWLIRDGKPYNWNEFLRRVNLAMNGDTSFCGGSQLGNKPDTVAATSAPQFTRDLKYTKATDKNAAYMKGEDVKALQKRLIDLEYYCGKSGADGVFGADTEKAVMAFKRDKMMNGIVDKTTWEALWK